MNTPSSRDPLPSVPSEGNDPTLDPALRSWVESANDPTSDFPIQNLPVGRFLPSDWLDDDEFASLVASGLPGRACMAIGDRVLDLDLLFHAQAIGPAGADEEEGLDELHHAIHHPRGPGLAAVSDEALRLLRSKVQQFLAFGNPGGQAARRLREKAVLAMKDVRLLTPVDVGNYTDFYASIHHATNVGSMFRPDNPLLPNYKHVPIGYHGRASSIVPSGATVRRPRGQALPDGAATPIFGPCRRLDYELEVGCIIGGENRLGEPVEINRAHEQIFGLCLVNDWSARDVQAWEYQPLGPFLAKNFATSVSPWIVTRQALAPFRIAGPARGEGEPQPLDYLRPSAGDAANWGFDINLEVLISSAKMREQGRVPQRVSLGNLREMYWTFPQMIAHHTSGGCNLRAGDLIASGTVSGSSPESRGCLLERTWAGNGPDQKPLPRTPIELATGEKRIFLEDGDEVIMRGWCERAGFRRIGLGECRGVVTPA